jgi:predicted O-methyltransferase YrrM
LSTLGRLLSPWLRAATDRRVFGDILSTSGGGTTLDVVTAALLVAAAVVGYFLWTFATGAGYEPVPNKILDLMIQMSHPSKGQRIYDLGSGFGRIIIRVAQTTGATCVGVDVDPIKVWWTRRAIRAKGLAGQVSVVRSNLLDADISQADMVFVFLWEGIMQKLGEKAKKEMKPGSLIVSYYHKIIGWQPEAEDAKHRVYVYRV